MQLRGHRRVLAGAVVAVPALLVLGSFVAPAPRLQAQAASTGAGLGLPTPTPTPIICLTSPTPLPLPGLPTPIPLPLCPTPPPVPAPTLPPPPPTPSLPLPTLPPILPTPNQGCPTCPPPPTQQISGVPPGGNGGGGGTTGTTGGYYGSTGTTGGAPGTGTSGAGGVTSSPVTWPHSVSGSLVIADPFLAAAIDQVLANPVAAQRPDLLHFSVTGSSPASWLLGGIFAAGTPSGPPPLSPQAALVLLLVAGGGTLIAFVLRGRRRKLIAALLVVPAALAIAVPAGAAVLSGHQTAQKTVAPTHHENQRTHTLAAWATSAVPTWTQLIAIENALSQQHDAIVNNETEIANLTVAWQTEYMHITPHTIHPMVFTVLAAQLRQLVQEHAALSTAYETSLQNEYTFFLNAAKNPVQLGALQTAATHTPANVQQAVQYDVTVVETQLSQEAAINAAAQQIVATQAVPTATPFALSAPVSGVVSQAFGPTSFSLEPPLTYNGFFYPHFHTGLDIAAPLNTLVGAAGPGQVILAGSSRDANGHLVGYGNYVVIRHPNGILTLYGHLNRILVTTGQIVGQGQVIGLLGSTGWSTGPHVHFEVRVNGMFVDPAPYIASQIR